MKLSDSSLVNELHAHVGGQWIKADNNKAFEVFSTFTVNYLLIRKTVIKAILNTPFSDPSTWEPITSVPDLDEAACSTAVQQAQVAFKELSALSGKKRGQLLRAWYNLVTDAKADLATIISTENGKPRNEAEGEVAYASDFIDWYSGAATRVEGTVRHVLSLFAYAYV